MMLSVYITVVLLMFSLVCVNSAPILCAYYKTNGLRQLAKNEGAKVLAPNGDKFFYTGSPQECVTACEVMVRKCGRECCTSVTYNPQRNECWLKVGGSQFDSQFNGAGWQTYWRVGSGSFNGDSADQLVKVAGGAAACESDLKATGYSEAYLSRGPGQLSTNEGNNIATSTGQSFKTVKTVDECAVECQAVQGCDSFTVNTNNRRCYLKQGATQTTKLSSDGWTTYWKVSESTAQVNCKLQDWYCLYCGGSYGNSCRNY